MKKLTKKLINNPITVTRKNNAEIRSVYYCCCSVNHSY